MRDERAGTDFLYFSHESTIDLRWSALAESGIIGREEELALLEQRLSAIVECGTAAVVLEGDPGIGKTTLFRWGVSSALERGYSVLSCRPSASEARLSYAGLGDLLGPLVPDTLPMLPVPQRHAVEIALRLREAERDAVDPGTIVTGFLNVVRQVTRSHVLVIAIDDLQWLDTPTAAVLEFAARRLHHEPLMLLATVRADSVRELPLDLERIFPDGRLSRICVGPLSPGEVHEVIRLRLGRTLPRPDLIRLDEVSAGNPFYAVEFALLLERRRIAVGQPIPIPERLEQLVEQRLAALPPRVRRVLEPAAALAEPTVGTVARATDGEDDASGALEAALRSNVIALDGERIHFAHPLLAASVYSQIAPFRRRQLHRRLAELVTDPEAQARHLALAASRPREQIAAAAEEAARLASRRGAPGTAAELCELAIQLTPRGRQSALRERKRAAARYHVAFGNPGRARVLLEELRDELLPGPERADVLRSLANLVLFDKQAQLALLEQALNEAADDDRLRGLIHRALGECWFVRGDSRHALTNHRQALALAERHDDLEETSLAISGLVLTELLAARPTPGLLERACALERETDDPSRTFTLGPGVMWVRLVQGRLAEARDLVEKSVAAAAAHGSEPGRMNGLCLLAMLEGMGGDLDSAAAHAAESCELMLQVFGTPHPWPLYAKAMADAHLGRVEDARDAAALGLAIAEHAGLFHGKIQHVAVLGFVELSREDAVGADRLLRPLLSELLARGWAIAPHAPSRDALEALIHVGELEHARELITRFDREAEELASPWLAACGEHLRGLLYSAEGELLRASAAFERALDAQEANDWPFERARTLLALGRTQRRAKYRRAARESLQAALALFEELGAPLWARQARGELARISGRAPGSGELTATEERVAALVAQGRSNKEAAAALYLSQHTVEGHLSRIYAKLGIRSRTELAHRLAREATRGRDN